MMRYNFRGKRQEARSKRGVLLTLDDGVFGKLQQQLFGACIAEVDGSLGIFSRSLNLHHRSHSETLVLYDMALAKSDITNG